MMLQLLWLLNLIFIPGASNDSCYNIHYQLNPEHVEKTNHDYADVIVKKIDMGEY